MYACLLSELCEVQLNFIIKTGSLDNAIQEFLTGQTIMIYEKLCNNQLNACILIGQSTMAYSASKLVEKSRVFWII